MTATAGARPLDEGCAPAGPPAWLDFRRFWAAHSVSTCGDQITLVALPLATYARTGSPLAVGVAASMEAATALVFGLVAGAMADRLPSRPLLLATDLARAAVLGALALLMASSGYPVWALYAAAFLLGALRVLHDAAAGSALPAVVPAPALLRANSRLQASESAATAVGPVLAGSMLAVGGPALAFVADAVTFAASGAAVGGIRSLDPAGRPGAAPAAGGAGIRAIVSDIRDGLRALRADAWLGRALALMASLNVVVIAVEAQFIPFARGELGLGPLGIGACFAVGGSAAVATSFVTGRREEVRGDVMVAGVACLSTGVLAAGLWPSLATAVLAYVLAGAGSALAVNHFNALRQRRFPAHLQGRIAMSTRLVVLGPLPVAYALGGTFAGAFGAPALFVVVASVGLAAAALGAARGLLRLRLA